MVSWWRRKRRVARGHRRWRGRYAERILRYTPTVMIEYPVELFVVFWGLTAGPPVLLGHPGSRAFELLPGWAQMLWAVLMIVGATAIGVGLWLRHYGTSVSRGLALVGNTLIAQAALIVIYGGVFFQWPAFAMLVGVGLLLHWRAIWLKARDSLHSNIAWEASG